MSFAEIENNQTLPERESGIMQRDALQQTLPTDSTVHGLSPGSNGAVHGARRDDNLAESTHVAVKRFGWRPFGLTLLLAGGAVALIAAFAGWGAWDNNALPLEITAPVVRTELPIVVTESGE